MSQRASQQVGRIAIAIIFLGGCADLEGQPETAEAVQAVESGTHYAIHVNGICSTNYGANDLGNFDGVVSIDAAVDQRHSMSEATADLTSVFDQHCTGENWCTVFTYSNGGAVASRALSLYGDQWNVFDVVATASNEGGSELSNWAGVVQLFSCDLINEIAPSDHRPAWNHHDTAGATFYMVAGNRCMFPWVQCWLLPGSDDGVVAYHSSGGMSDTFSSRRLCGSEPRYSNHEIGFSCNGVRKNHLSMKNEGVCQAGGC